MKPRCTILLPVHNGLPYITLAVESLLSQTEKNILIYILDDGSTDGTIEYLNTLTHASIQIFPLSKRGLPAVLNFGIERVTTEYVARMDADDISYPTRIEEQIKYLDLNQDHVLVGGRIRYLSEDGLRKSWEVKLPLNDETILSGMYSRRGVISHPTIMCRTDYLKKVNGYDALTFPSEDYDLYFRLSKIGKLANLPAVLLDMRVHGKSITRLNLFRIYAQYAISVEKYSGIKTTKFKRIFLFIDSIGVIIYRRGLEHYLNTNRVYGCILIGLAALVNPVRFFYFIQNRFIKN